MMSGKADFPSWQDCLDEFAAGLRESKGREEAIHVSPHLRQPVQTYADFMAGRAKAAERPDGI